MVYPGDEVICCSFCGRTAREATSMVAGPEEVYICDQCVSHAAGIVEGDLHAPRPAPPHASPREAGRRLPPPHELKQRLDEYVVGQHQAKKALAVAVYNHYKRIDPAHQHLREFADVELEKSNILLIGPTGTGKTLLARTLARILDVPFSISDATALTEAGYVGEDVESILAHLLHAADFDVDATEQGIIYLDEIDKVARKTDSASITRDVSGEGVQQALLKILEGTVAGVPPEGGRKHPEQNLVDVDTRNILFICGGAFAGLEEIVARRRSLGAIGFHADPKRHVQADDAHILHHIEPDDLMRFGLIPELVGRLPVTATLDTLSDAAMKRILTEPKNALVKQYRKLFAMDRFDLVFDDAALDVVVEKAQALGTGARGLRSVLEGTMLDIMYDLHRRATPGICRVTAATVCEGAPPVFERRRASA